MKTFPKTLMITIISCLLCFIACENDSTFEQSDNSGNSVVIEKLSRAATSDDINLWLNTITSNETILFEEEKKTTPLAPLHTVDYVDISRYTGRWYGIANFPRPFNEGCSCTVANYGIIDVGLSVANKCIRNDGNDTGGATGKAIVVDTLSNAKLKVNFPPSSIYGDYWIIDLVDNGSHKPYSFSVVSDPTRNSLFILSRTPRITTVRQKNELLKIFRNLILQGYDLKKLKIIPQENCNYSFFKG